MMPLLFAKVGEEQTIKRVTGSPDVKKHLGDMGFTVGERISVLSAAGENMIVSIKGARVAINGGTARRIIV